MSVFDSIVVSAVVAVPPAEAFTVFTQEIGRWWRPKGPRLFRPDRDGVLKFDSGCLIFDSGGADTFVVGRVLAWDPGRRLVFEWRQAGFAPHEVTEVEVRFESFGSGTRVTVEHRGWDAIPSDHPARSGFQGGAFTSIIGLRWADALTALRGL
jgi:uncharacterized protein YndB with AHSA1/START domain